MQALPGLNLREDIYQSFRWNIGVFDCETLRYKAPNRRRVGRTHFGEVRKTRLVSNQIFAWQKIEDLQHKVISNAAKLLDSF